MPPIMIALLCPKRSLEPHAQVIAGRPTRGVVGEGEVGKEVAAKAVLEAGEVLVQPSGGTSGPSSWLHEGECDGASDGLCRSKQVPTVHLSEKTK